MLFNNLLKILHGLLNKMKYLKVILSKPESENFHITYAYFGKDFTDSHKLHELLENFKCFDLNYIGDDLFGPNNNIPVHKYSVVQESIDYRDNFINQLSKMVIDQNRFPWAPHITKPLTEPPKKLRVVGLESDDGNFSVTGSN